MEAICVLVTSRMFCRRAPQISLDTLSRSMQAHGFENVHRVDAKTKDCPEYVQHQHLASTPAQKRALPILLSHQFALKTAYEDPARHPFVLVLEDDVSMEFAPFWHHQNLDRFAARLPTGWLAVQHLWRLLEQRLEHRVHLNQR